MERADKLGIANLIYAVWDSGDGKRIRLIIDFSKVCTKSESAFMFWDQDAWGTPVTLTFFYYVTIQHVLDFFVK